jgi:hypothetical protein
MNKGRKPILTNVSELTPILQIRYEEILPEAINELDFYELLSKNKIVFGLLKENISEILSTKGSERRLIAKADKPKVIFLFPFTLLDNYKNGQKISENQFFATNTPLPIIENGKNVFGEPVIFTLQRLSPNISKFIEISKEGLFSNINGFLEFTDLSIDIKANGSPSKNINFNSPTNISEEPVYIEGDVSDLTMFYSKKDFFLNGSLSNSIILCEENIHILGNVENCQLISGASSFLFQDIIDFAIDSKHSLEKVIANSSFEENIKAHNHSILYVRSETQRLLIKHSLLFSYGAIQKEESFNNYFQELLRLVKISKLLLENEILILNKLSEHISSLQKFIDNMILSLPEKKGSIFTQSINRSIAFASDTIEISGSGVFLSTLFSTNRIRILGSSISSSLKTRNNVSIKNFDSSDNENFCLNITEQEGFALIEKTSAGSFIKIGDHSIRTEKQILNHTFLYKNL